MKFSATPIELSRTKPDIFLKKKLNYGNNLFKIFFFLIKVRQEFFLINFRPQKWSLQDSELTIDF